jgi:hypothetical protein
MSTFTSVGSPGTLSTASGGNILGYNNISTTPSVIAPADPARKSITFHNPSAIDIFVSPATIQNTGSDVPLVPSTAAPGGCFLIFANGGTLVIEGECQKPWQAFSRTGSAQSLTVMVTHV